jgi:hypothetical protein
MAMTDKPGRKRVLSPTLCFLAAIVIWTVFSVLRLAGVPWRPTTTWSDIICLALVVVGVIWALVGRNR